MPSDRRLLLVHAHPDDESIATGVTMAKYAAEGAHVTLVTCTLGEEGEVLVPALTHLGSNQDDALGKHRIGELAAAMEALGVRDYRFLGGAGRYRDTGMVYAPNGVSAAVPPNLRPDTFWAADLREAATDLVEVIRQVRPQVLITYDDFGGYGHPDHVQAHRVATYAAFLAAVPSYRPDLGDSWDVAKVYWTCVPRSVFEDSNRRMKEAGLEHMDETDFGNLPFIVDDKFITTRIDGTAYLDHKIAAMRAHPTQIAVDGYFFALANNVGRAVMGVEYYRLAKGTLGPTGPDGLEDDLFAGTSPVAYAGIPAAPAVDLGETGHLPTGNRPVSPRSTPA
jgi:N-acetyl-1-D-myo-inositol-2-amino-2-deoxy-alpha-D-glucopyranoside deacetylase